MSPDYIIRNVNIYQTFRQCFELRDAAVKDGRFYAVLPVNSGVYPEGVPVYDAQGRYMIPGLIDIHMCSI